MRKRGNTPFYCSPTISNANNGVCLDREGLIHLIARYNSNNVDSIVVSQNDSDQTLIRKIREKLKTCKGKRDWCWANLSFTENDEKIQRYYKPKIPKQRYQWLKTTDIDKVLKPYEDVYTDFEFLGTVPLDFDNIRQFRFSQLDYCRLYNGQGKCRFGAVFNLDTSDKRGSHWVSMFCDLSRNYIAFFDSVGVKQPPREILALMRNIKRQFECCRDHKLQKYVANNINLKVNRRNIQKGNTECGVFSIYFIRSCLEGRTPDEIFSDPYLTDKTVNYFRADVFRPSMDSDNEIYEESGYQI